VVASLDSALLRAADAPRELTSRARLVRARHLGVMGRFAVAFDDAAAAIDDARARGDTADLAAGLLERGILWHRQRRARDARDAYEEARELASSHDDLRIEARAEANLAALHYDTGRLKEARRAYETAIALHEALEWGAQLGPCFANYAVLLQELGHLPEARAAYERALGHLREEGDRRREAIALGNFGMLELETGSYVAALTCHDDARRLLSEVADPHSEALCLYRLAATFAVLERFDEGRRAFALAERLRRRGVLGLDEAASVYNAFLCYAEANNARKLGDARESEELVAEAEGFVAKASAAVNAGSSLGADDARAALRVLEPLRRAMSAGPRGGAPPPDTV
jgi:tetratricopeptide (TPR) repeat protein